MEETSSTNHNRYATIGVSLAETYRGQGYGSESIRWILEWGFTAADLHRISLEAYVLNDRAIRLYERLGFMCEVICREPIWHDRSNTFTLPSST
jgi:RimJ/RimL family protein N-acetyltransferase